MENYYRLTVAGIGEYYEFGNTALDAIATVREDLAGTAAAYGAITARPAVYGEWECKPQHYRNDGSHSHDYN